MLTAVTRFTKPLLNTTTRAAAAEVSVSRNLSNLSSKNIQSRGIHSSRVLYDKDLKSTATPEKRPDGGVLSRFKDKIATLCESAGVKLSSYKLEEKMLVDADKIGPWYAKVSEHSFGIAAREDNWKSRFLDLKAKSELKGAQVNIGEGVSRSMEVYAGKGTILGEIGVKSLHLTDQARLNVTGGVGLGYLFIGWKDQVTGGLDGVEAPSLKNFRMELLKPILSAQLERRDLQNGTLAMAKLNAANLLDWVIKAAEGEPLDPTKMITIEKKVFDAELNRIYHALGQDFAQAFEAMKKAGVPKQIDDIVEHGLGDWRSDGEGWSPEALDMLKSDILNSQVLASTLALTKENADAVPIYRLAARFHDEFVIR